MRFPGGELAPMESGNRSFGLTNYVLLSSRSHES